jgi:hypothetical protein
LGLFSDTVRVRRNTTKMFSKVFQRDDAINFVNFKLQTPLSTIFVTCSDLSGKAKTSMKAAQYKAAIPDSRASTLSPRVGATRTSDTLLPSSSAPLPRVPSTTQLESCRRHSSSPSQHDQDVRGGCPVLCWVWKAVLP